MINLRHFTKFALLTLLLCSILYSATVIAQETTEQYIPIGQSPGVSTEYSYIGMIVDTNEEEHSIVVRSNRGEKTMRITDATRLWLDKSKQRQTSVDASYDDCEVGRKVEVKYRHDDHGVADWVKIEAP